jgi:hypothetical protein
MLQNLQSLEDLIRSAETFLIPLRMMRGFETEEFRKLCTALQACATEWEQAELIPKLGANVLVDLYPSMLAASYLYPDNMGEMIREQAEHLADLVRACVSTSN